MSIKYEKIGLRRDRNLSDLTDAKQGLTNILNDLALPGEKFIGDDLFVINNLAQTNVTLDDFSNFADIAVDATQLRYVLRIKAETISETLTFDPGYKFFLNGLEIEVVNASTPIDPTITGNANNRWEFDLILQTTVENFGISVNDILDLNNQPVYVLELQDVLKTTNEFTIQPLITIKDQVEFFRLNTGFEQMFAQAGRGPVAKFYASNELNPAFDLLNSNNPTNRSPLWNINGDTIVSHSGNNESPVSFGNFNFWDQGSFIFSNKMFDSARFSDGQGVVQWEGFFALDDYTFSYLEEVVAKTNGEFLWEQWDEDTNTWKLIGSLINGFEVQVSWNESDQRYEIVDNGFPAGYEYLNIAPGLSIYPAQNVGYTTGDPTKPWEIDSVNYEEKGSSPTSFSLVHRADLVSAPGYGLDVLPSVVKIYNNRPSNLSNIPSLIRYFNTKSHGEYVKTRVTLIFKDIGIPYDRKYFNVTQRSTGLPYYKWYDNYDPSLAATNKESLEFYEQNAVDHYQNKINTSLKINDLSVIRHEPSNTRNYYIDALDMYNTYRFNVRLGTNNSDRTVILPTHLKTSSPTYQEYDYKDYSKKSFKRGDYILNIQQRNRSFTLKTRFIRNAGIENFVATRQQNPELTQSLQSIYSDYEGVQKQEVSIDVFKTKLPFIGDRAMLTYYDDDVLPNHNTKNPDRHFHYPPQIYSFGDTPGSQSGWTTFGDFEFFNLKLWGLDVGLTFTGGQNTFSGSNNQVDYSTWGEEVEYGPKVRFIADWQVPATENLIIPSDGIVDIWYDDGQVTKSVIADTSDPEIQQEGVGPKYVSEGNLVYTMKLHSDDFFANDFSEIIHVYDVSNLATNNNVINIPNHGFGDNQLVLVSDYNTGALGTTVANRVPGGLDTQRMLMRIDYVDADNFRLFKNVSDGLIAGAQYVFTVPESSSILTSADVAIEGGDISIMSFGFYNGAQRSIGDFSVSNSPEEVEMAGQFEVFSTAPIAFVSGVHSITSTSSPQPAGFQQYIQWSVIGDFNISDFPQEEGSDLEYWVMFSGLTDSAFDYRVFQLFDVGGEWLMNARQDEFSAQYNLMGSNTEMIILRKTGSSAGVLAESDDTTFIFKYKTDAPFNNRIVSLYADNNNNEILNSYSYNDETGEIQYTLDNYQNSSMRNVYPGRTLNSTVDTDPSCRYIHIIQSHRGLNDYSKLSYCEGVVGKELLFDAPAGSTSLTLKDGGGAVSVGQIVQFADYIPNATTIQAVVPAGNGVTITLSNATIKPLNADYTVTISNDNLRNYEICTSILNTAPPFEGTEQGLKTVSGSENLQVNEILFDSMKLDTIAVQNLTPDLGVEYSNTLDINYEAPNGQIKSFKLLSK